MGDLGNLSQCMVDSDAAANGRAKLLRGKALVASLCLEAVVIAGVLLWPLATLGTLTTRLQLTPLPPYLGLPRPNPAPPHVSDGPLVHRTNARLTPLYQPPVIPRHVLEGANPEPPSVGPDELVGPGIAEGFRDGGPIEIARPPRPQPPSRPVVRNAEVMEAMLVRRVQPEYPRIAITIHLAGTVVLRARIGTDGTVRDLETLSGNAILADAARAAVLQWRYRPTMLNGQAVEVETQITVNFVLNSE